MFAGEPRAEQSLPDEDSLGEDFITWLRRTFGWLFGRAQSNTSLGSAFVFGDGPIPPWAVLGEYDNGSASGKGRTEYIWLPTADGAIPIAIWRNNKFFSIHGDHLGTPRQMRSEANQVLWQWPYSAFGDNEPSGILKATPKPNAAITHQPLLKATKPQQALDLRFPGQYADEHAGQFYNLHRMYLAGQGRYTQGDPIGLEGGINTYAYVGSAPTMYTDPLGLQTSLQWCYQSPANAATCNEAGMTPKPIALPPPIVFPDDCDDQCRKAVVDASNAYWKLTSKRMPQYESGGTQGRDPGHAKAIKELQVALQKAINRVRRHCKVLPAQLPEWERAANTPLPG